MSVACMFDASSLANEPAAFFFFFLNDPAPTEFSPLPLHDALPFSFKTAVLSTARASSASLYAINLRNSSLLRTDLSRSDMRDARLEHAVLSFANLEQTDLSSEIGRAHV